MTTALPSEAVLSAISQDGVGVYFTSFLFPDTESIYQLLNMEKHLTICFMGLLMMPLIWCWRRSPQRLSSPPMAPSKLVVKPYEKHCIKPPILKALQDLLAAIPLAIVPTTLLALFNSKTLVPAYRDWRIIVFRTHSHMNRFNPLIPDSS